MSKTSQIENEKKKKQILYEIDLSLLVQINIILMGYINNFLFKF